MLKNELCTAQGDDAENDYYDLNALAEAVGKEFIATGADLFLALDNEDTPYATGAERPDQAEVQAEEKAAYGIIAKNWLYFLTQKIKIPVDKAAPLCYKYFKPMKRK